MPEVMKAAIPNASLPKMLATAGSKNIRIIPATKYKVILSSQLITDFP
jgi:hypothetical protein